MTKVNVVVGRKRPVQVTANATAGIISTNKNNVTLKPGIQSQPQMRLDTLVDVVAAGETNGAVPVYDSESDKYIVQKIDISNVTGAIDGGTF
jgi:hypothetical protein